MENLEKKSGFNFTKVAIIATLTLATGLIPMLNGIDRAFTAYRGYQKMKSDVEDLKKCEEQRKKGQEALERYEKFKSHLLNPQQQEQLKREGPRREYNTGLKHC